MNRTNLEDLKDLINQFKAINKAKDDKIKKLQDELNDLRWSGFELMRLKDELASIVAANSKTAEVSSETNANMFKKGDVVVVIYKRNSVNYVGEIDIIDIYKGDHCFRLSKAIAWHDKDSVRHATKEEKERFFSKNPKLHPFHRLEYGNMEGWRYLEKDENTETTDEFWNYLSHKWSNDFIIPGRQNNNGYPYRRKVS